MKASWVQVIFSLTANTLQLIFSCHTKYRLSLYSSYNIIILWRCNYCQKFRTHNKKFLKVLKVDGCNVVLSLNHLLEKCPPTEYYKSSLNQINQLTIWSFTILFSFSYEDKKIHTWTFMETYKTAILNRKIKQKQDIINYNTI